jgi:hypothetical protein
MNRLSIADLKAQANNVVANLEAIKGGEDSNIPGVSTTMPADKTRVEKPKPKL